MRAYPRPIRRLLDGADHSSNSLLARIERLTDLGGEVERSLPPGVAAHCRVANLRDDVLVLLVDSAAWATRLRYHGPALLKQLRHHAALSTLRDIRVRVAPIDSQPVTRTTVKPTLSRTAAELLQATADSTSNPELRAALRRLASRGR